MKMLHTLATSVVLISSITTAAQAGDTDDPPGFSQDFDFFDAWGVHPIKESGMALLPDESGLPPNEDGLYQFYDVGVSFASEGDKTPSFQGYGTLEGLELWALPDEYNYTQIDLESFDQIGGDSSYQGSAQFVGLLFLGRLSTPTGYNEIVTGKIIVSQIDFESPEVLTIGSMILLPQYEWMSSDDARVYNNEMASPVSPFIVIEVESEDDETNEKDNRVKCQTIRTASMEDCFEQYIDCLRNAQSAYNACMRNITVEDGFNQGAGFGGLVGGGIGAGVGFVCGAGIGSVPGYAVGAGVGVFIGSCVGTGVGVQNLKDKCWNDLLAARERCMNIRRRCESNADREYEICAKGHSQE